MERTRHLPSHRLQVTHPSLTVDGTAVTLTNNAYTLTDVTTSHTVVASFSVLNNISGWECTKRSLQAEVW